MVKRLRGRANQERRSRYFQDHPLCVNCTSHGRTTAAQELDHIKPLSQGGTDEPDNWQGLCIPCHKDKSLRDRGITPKPTIGLDGWPVNS